MITNKIPHKKLGNASVGASFTGYPAPTSNTIYTPNQFFDVVLPHSSRGCVRLVAYMLRRTLGWCDKEGNTMEPQVTFSYSDLEKHAGISRSMIHPAISEATSSNFIRCVQKGIPNQLGSIGSSALYELCWDESGHYTTDFNEFKGFFALEGNRTYIPNAFFDYTIPNEQLSVIKITGAIIRHTIGFQTKFGHRRQQVRLSFTHLQRITKISSRRCLSEAIKTATQNNHITKLEPGFFDIEAGKTSEATLYGLHWATEDSSKRIPGKSSKNPLSSNRMVRKGYRGQCEKDTENGLKRIPARQCEKDTGIEITNINNTFKQQRGVPAARLASPRQSRQAWDCQCGKVNVEVNKQVSGNLSIENRKQDNGNLSAGGTDADVCFDRLVQEGFDKKTARYLISKFSTATILAQTNALPFRNPSKNKLGMLRRSIEENWPLPETQDPSPELLPALFATHVYAAWAGNLSTPVSSPSVSDVSAARTFLSAFPKAASPDTVIALARRFGEFIRSGEQRTQPVMRSLVLAVRIFGDKFTQEIAISKTKQNKKLFSSKPTGQDSSEQKLTPEQIEILRQKKENLQNNSPTLWRKFCEEESTKRKRLETFSAISKEVRKAVLAHFDFEESQLRRLGEFFKYTFYSN